MEQESRKSVIMQAGILASASIIVRIIGLLYRAPLTAVIGDEGNGYYGFAYNIYTIILMISSYSVPSALSKIMAQKLAQGQYRNAQRVFHAALVYNMAVGVFFGLIMFFGASWLVPPNSVSVLRVFAPTIFLFGILGAFRGYYQAQGTMVQTSVSQILEQIANAVVSIGAAALLIHLVADQDATTKARYGAMGSALGTGSGVLIALLFMGWTYYLNRPYYLRKVASDRTEYEESFSHVMRETILVITPFILSSFILNLTTALNQTVYSKIMIGARNYDEAIISTLYGIFSNKAVVITNIPISIATAFSAAIIPGIASAHAHGKREDTRRRALDAKRMTLLIAIPSAGGLIALARPITMLLFPQPASLPMASRLLAMLAVTVVFYSISTVTNAVLQSIGRMSLPLVSASAALAVQTIVLVVLIRYTKLSVYALVIVSILYSILIFLLNEFFLHRYLRVQDDVINMYAKPIAAALIMGSMAFSVYHLCSWILQKIGMKREYFINLVAVIPALIVAVLVYFFILIRSGALTEEEILQLPKGHSMVRILRKLRWI